MIGRRWSGWKDLEVQVDRPLRSPAKEECIFYHSMTYPNGESVQGAWDIRGSFDQYIGSYPISGKTVLDVGTAGGFLAFEAERSGARVTALDALYASEFERLHFGDSLYHLDRPSHVARIESWFKKLKSGFWYSWERYKSNVEMVYMPLARLPYWERKFDVVIAGALLEHLADPVSVIGNLAGLAREAVIIAFTPVIEADDQFMETMTDWKNPEHNFTFWTLSSGLYKRIFENLGFSIKFVAATAQIGEHQYIRSTIIARRIEPAARAQQNGETAHGEVGDDSTKSGGHFVASRQLWQGQLDTAVAERDAAIAQCNRVIEQRNAATAEVAALRLSSSWRLTSPFRALSSIFQSRR